MDIGVLKRRVLHYPDVEVYEKELENGAVLAILRGGFRKQNPKEYMDNVVSAYVANSPYNEFKYVRSSSLSSDEAIRYIDDIFRLFSIVKNNNRAHSYFLITGKEQDYDFIFKSLNERNAVNRAITQNQTTNYNLFNNVFPQKLRMSKSFQASSLSHNNEHMLINTFNNTYKYKRGKARIEGTDMMRTKLIYSSKLDKNRVENPITVKLWEIYKQQ